MLDHHAKNFRAAILNSTPNVSAVHTSQVLRLPCCSILAAFSARVHSLAVMMNVFTDCITSKLKVRSLQQDCSLAAL